MEEREREGKQKKVQRHVEGSSFMCEKKWKIKRIRG